MARRICYVHAGTGKTGTSAMQYALTAAHGYLLSRGFHYPNISGNFEHVLNGKPTAGNAGAVGQTLRQHGGERAMRLLEPFSHRPEHLILSCEGFSNRSTQRLGELARGLEALGYDLRCLVLFRPQVDMIVSSFLQQVKADKTGTEITLGDRVERLFGSHRPEAGWNWYERAQKLEAVFGSDNLTVGWYPVFARRGPTGVIAAVFDWLGVALPDDRPARYGKIINPTPGREALAILQRLNSQGLGGKNVADTFLLKAQEEGLLGGKVALSPALASMVESATHGSNVKLLERYCSGLSVQDELRPSLNHDQAEPLDEKRMDRLARIAADILDGGKGAVPRRPVKRGGAEVEVAELIEQIRLSDPDLLDGIPKDKAAGLIHGLFTHINDAIAAMESGWVKFSGLGQFRVRRVERDLGGERRAQTQIVFRRDEPGRDAEAHCIEADN